MSTSNPITVNPIDNPEAQYTLILGGVPLPGVIPPDGISGWGIKTSWEVKKGKGADDATITDTGDDPAKGKVKTQLWLPEHFAQWSNFVIALRQMRAQAFDLVHPIINQLEVTSVVVEEISQIEPQGKGLYIAELSLLKWVPQPKTVAGGTPNGSQDKDGSGTKDPNDKTPPDPNQSRIDDFNKKLKQARDLPDED